MRGSRFACGLIAASMLLPASVVSAGPPLERLLPEDCFLLATARDVPGIMLRAKSLSLAAAVNDPAMKVFVEDLTRQVRQVLSGTSSEIGVDIERLMDHLKGSMAMALRLDGAKTGKDAQEFYILVDLGDKESEAKTLIENMINKSVREGAFTKRVVGEVTILASTKSSDPESNRMCYGVKGGVLVASNMAELVAKTMRAVPGGVSQSLFDNPKLMKMRRTFAKQAKGLGDAEFYVLDLEALAKVTPSQRPGGTDLASARNMQAVGISFSVGKSDYELLGQFMVLPSASLDLNADNVMTSEPLPIEPWVPANVINYATWNFDVDKFYVNMKKQLDLLSPGAIERAEEQLREFPDRANPLISSIEKDIVAPAGNRMTLVVDRADVGGKQQERTLFAWKLRDASKFGRLLEGVMAQFGPQLGQLVTKKTVKGYTVHVIPAQIFGSRSPIPLGNAAIAVTNTHLLITTHVEFMDRILNFEGQAGLAEFAPAQRVAAKFPQRPGAVGYMRADELGRLIFAAVKTRQVRQSIAGFLESIQVIKKSAPGLAAAITSDKLPEFEQVKQYFKASGGAYFVVEEDAVRMSVFTGR